MSISTIIKVREEYKIMYIIITTNYHFIFVKRIDIINGIFFSIIISIYQFKKFLIKHILSFIILFLLKIFNSNFGI